MGFQNIIKLFKSDEQNLNYTHVFKSKTPQVLDCTHIHTLEDIFDLSSPKSGPSSSREAVD